jgi:hypothetical protein
MSGLDLLLALREEQIDVGSQRTAYPLAYYQPWAARVS